jgi:hypothetical protein
MEHPAAPQKLAEGESSSDTSQLSDSFALSSSLNLPGAGEGGGSGKGKKATYW